MTPITEAAIVVYCITFATALTLALWPGLVAEEERGILTRRLTAPIGAISTVINVLCAIQITMTPF